MLVIYYDLQLFADPNMNTTTSSGLTVEMKTYYDMELLDNAKPALVHAQFADERPLPKNKGKTIEFRRYSPLPKAMTPLTEGVTPDGTSLNASAITARIDQYGAYTTLSDTYNLTAIDNNLREASALLGNQGGLTLDTVARNEIVGGTNVLYTTGTTRSGLTANSKLTMNDIFKAAAILKAANAPTIDGYYVAIIHPYCSLDIMTEAKESGTWVDINKYSNAENIFKGELGRVAGVRFVETSEAKIWKGEEDNCPDGLAVFATMVVGKNAYAKTSLEGGGMEMIIKPFGAGDDPLNQRATIGWKASSVFKRLTEEYMVRIESTSSMSADVEAN